MTVALHDPKPTFVTLKPLAALNERIADARTQKTWTARDRAIRTCQWCKVPYLSGGDAGKCEKNHEGLLGL